MTEVFQFLAVLLAAFGLVSLVWLAVGALLLPGVCPARLEQSVKALLWLRRTGLWWGEVVIEDCGLSREGEALARALSEQPGVEFSADDFDRV